MPCIKSLIADYKAAGGVCAGSDNWGEYPESDIPCDESGVPGDALCSAATESLLLEEDCRDYVFNNKEEVYQTIRWVLIYNMCTRDTFRAFVPSSGDKRKSVQYYGSVQGGHYSAFRAFWGPRRAV